MTSTLLQIFECTNNLKQSEIKIEKLNQLKSSVEQNLIDLTLEKETIDSEMLQLKTDAEEQLIIWKSNPLNMSTSYEIADTFNKQYINFNDRLTKITNRITRLTTYINQLDLDIAAAELDLQNYTTICEDNLQLIHDS